MALCDEPCLLATLHFLVPRRLHADGIGAELGLGDGIVDDLRASLPGRPLFGKLCLQCMRTMIVMCEFSWMVEVSSATG